MPTVDIKTMTDADIVGTEDLMHNFNALKDGIEASTDTIVDHGNSGIWHWEKYESGLMVCEGRTADASVAINQARGSWYIADIENLVSLPAGFIAKPNVYPVAYPTSGIVLAAAWDNSTTAAKIAVSLISPTSVTRTVSVGLKVEGRWK